MTREEAIRKLEYSKKAYQMLIDEKVDSGKLVGKDIKGEWEADTPLDEVYKSMIDTLKIAIEALEQELVLDKIRDEILDNAFLVVNPKNTYEFISAIDLDDINKILDKYKGTIRNDD